MKKHGVWGQLFILSLSLLGLAPPASAALTTFVYESFSGPNLELTAVLEIDLAQPFTPVSLQQVTRPQIHLADVTHIPSGKTYSLANLDFPSSTASLSLFATATGEVDFYCSTACPPSTNRIFSWQDGSEFVWLNSLSGEESVMYQGFFGDVFFDDGNGHFEVQNMGAVPVPSSLLLVATGLLGLITVRGWDRLNR